MLMTKFNNFVFATESDFLYLWLLWIALFYGCPCEMSTDPSLNTDHLDIAALLSSTHKVSVILCEV